MSYLYIKSLHIIFMVCWFAGIFYLVRLMIYFKESEEKELNSRKILQDQYTIMTKRLLYFITWPACFLTFLFGGFDVNFSFPELKQLAKTSYTYEGGVGIPPELTALTLALTLYTATFIAENVRAGIQGIGKVKKRLQPQLG